MKIVKLSGAQTNSLEAMGVDITADVLVPFGRGPGTYSFCDYCYHQRYEIRDGGSHQVCGNPVVKTGLQDCFFITDKGKSYEELPE